MLANQTFTSPARHSPATCAALLRSQPPPPTNTDSTDAHHLARRNLARPETPVEHQILYPYGVGIDTHSKFIQVCVLFQTDGNVVRLEQEFETDWPSLLAARDWIISTLEARKLLPDDSQLRYCIESTGTYHMPVLKALGGIPSVVNPLLAGPTRRKTDVLDARLLAHHSITGVWKPSFIPVEQAQVLRVLWANRREALRAATRASNRINNIILRFGHTFGAKAVMRTSYSEGVLSDLIEGKTPDQPGVCPEGLPAEIRPVIAALLADMQNAVTVGRKATQAAEAYVKSRSWPTGTKEIPGTELLTLLQTVPGVGITTALTWLAEVTDPRRFQNPEQVAAYCGCDPSLKISAGKVTSQVRRAGNLRLHQALLYAASGLIRKPADLIGNWGRAIAGRHKKGGYRKACGAVARRISHGCWHVHMRGEPFSYDGYNLTGKPQVPDVPLATILRPPAVKILREHGINDTQSLADAYAAGKLAALHGFGATSINAVKEWVIANRKYKSNKAPSAPDQPGPHTGAPKPGKQSSGRDYVLSPSRTKPNKGT